MLRPRKVRAQPKPHRLTSRASMDVIPVVHYTQGLPLVHSRANTTSIACKIPHRIRAIASPAARLEHRQTLRPTAYYTVALALISLSK